MPAAKSAVVSFRVSPGFGEALDLGAAREHRTQRKHGRAFAIQALTRARDTVSQTVDRGAKCPQPYAEKKG
jgi:hypothetical protein